MATSGSFDTTHRVSGSYNTYAHFDWHQTGQSTANNTTSIDWTFSGRTASSHQYIYVYGASVTVDGSTKSGWSGNMYNGTQMLSGSKTITHNSDGTKTFGASGYITQYSSSANYSGSGSWTLNTIPRKATLKTYPDFNDEGNPTITYENKAGTSVSSLQACISLTGSADDIAYRDVSKTGTSYTFNLTQAERNVLLNATKTSKTRKVYFYLRTIIGGNTFYDSKEVTFSVVNANPTFSNFTYADTNSTTTAITGNNQYIIQGKSTLRATIASANKATANKNATMVQYDFAIADYASIEAYATSDINKDIGVINASVDQTLKVVARDSRDNTTTVQKNVHIVPYASPSIIATATRQSNFESNTTIHIGGAMSLLSVAGVTKNAVDASNGIKWRYKESTSSTWGSWTNVASTTSADGTVSVTDFVRTFDNKKAWDLQFSITDKLETKTINVSLGQGQPQFFIGADGRVSVGGLPSRAIANNELGQFEVFGNIYGKEGRYDANTAVSPDTTEQWAKQFGNGHFFIKYSENNKFASQPSQWGILEVWIDNTDVRQIWHQLPSGNIWTRCGNANGWSTTRWHIVETRESGSQGGLWSSFYFDKIVSDTDVVVYTKKGTELTLRRGNGGVVLYCKAGARNINIARCSWAQSYSPSINGNYGVHGLKPSSKIYTRFLGALVNNGSAGVGEYASTAENFTPGYGDLASTVGGSSTRSASYCSMTMMRIKKSTKWEIQGNVSSDGVATSMDFDAHITVPDLNYIPGTYQRGATDNNTKNSWCLFEVFEP